MEALDIPIFQKVYDLYKLLASYRALVPKADRHGLWQKVESVSIAIIEHLLLAGQKAPMEKREPLEHASVQLNLLRILLRLAKDTRAIDGKQYVATQLLIDEIGRMLGGWLKSTRMATGKPPPRFLLNNDERRKCRAAARNQFGFGLLSQLLLTLTRPSLTLRLARLPFAVC